MVQQFEFVEAGRKFYCSVESPRHAGMPPWWWFHFDSKESTRYAPFEASATDTKQSVQKRILAFYAELLAIEARPVHPRHHALSWRKPVRVPPAAQSPATSTATAEV